MRLDSAKPGWFRLRRRRGEGPRTLATTSNTATKQRNAGNSVKEADQSRAAAKQPDARVAPSL
ncbi:hypothetical protein ABH935_003703 [Catenulispora sp. GAS73]|uniref:hypothetical protein n=1 Tax=Catenulispora sp. GAS73 TaxID=3156269 RepID=UPI0035175722